MITIGVTGPSGGIPWAWWATSYQLKRAGVRAVRLHPAGRVPDRPLDGLVIGGGNDIDPAVYGGDVSLSRSADPERDRFELGMLDRALEEELPVLGICRGAQLINVHAGGTLFGDLGKHRIHTSNKGTLLPRKRVTVEPGSLVEQLLGSTTTTVNSLHHQAVKATGKDLLATAHDKDGIVQAIESSTGPLRVGVQWHPEYMPQRADQTRLFRQFVRLCRS